MKKYVVLISIALLFSCCKPSTEIHDPAALVTGTYRIPVDPTQTTFRFYEINGHWYVSDETRGFLVHEGACPVELYSTTVPKKQKDNEAIAGFHYGWGNDSPNQRIETVLQYDKSPGVQECIVLTAFLLFIAWVVYQSLKGQPTTAELRYRWPHQKNR